MHNMHAILFCLFSRYPDILPNKDCRLFIKSPTAGQQTFHIPKPPMQSNRAADEVEPSVIENG